MMFRHPYRLCLYSLLSLGVWLGAAVGMRAGDSILYSEADVPIASPRAGAAPKLPERAAELTDRDFGQPQTAIPFIRPPVVRPEPRKQEKRTLFDEPALFSGKSKDGGDRDKEAGANSLRKPASKPYGFPADASQRPDEARAFSTEQRFEWDTQNKGAREQSTISSFDDRTSTSRDEKNSPDSRRPGASVPDGGELSFFQFLNPNVRRELTANQIERRAEFEKLINPEFTPLGSRHANPFEPASPLDSARKAMPPPASALSITPAGATFNPMRKFEDQERSWRGPSAEDLNKKAIGSFTAPAPARTESARPQRPLLNQSGNDFPGRKF